MLVDPEVRLVRTVERAMEERLVVMVSLLCMVLVVQLVPLARSFV